MGRTKYDVTYLSDIAKRNTRGPQDDRELAAPASLRCQWKLCGTPIDRSRPRTKHQRFCSTKCRKAAFDDQLRAGASKRRSEAS